MGEGRGTYPILSATPPPEIQRPLSLNPLASDVARSMSSTRGSVFGVENRPHVMANFLIRDAGYPTANKGFGFIHPHRYCIRQPSLGRNAKTGIVDSQNINQ